jgi:hypothetical protein
MRRSVDKSPDARYSTATDFVTVLRIALEERPARQETVRKASTAPRPPDPWTSLQMEIREQHRTQQGTQPAPARKSRRAFLVKAGALAAGTVGGGWLAWSLLRGHAAPVTTSRDELTAPGARTPTWPASTVATPAATMSTGGPRATPPGEAEDGLTSGPAGSDLGAGTVPTGGHRAAGF